MIYAFIVLHVIVCFFLVVVVLLQSGKAADLAGAFGGMGSQTAFGPRGSATVLSKATTIAAALFMVTSLSLAVLNTREAGGSSVLHKNQSVKPATPQQKQPELEIEMGGKKKVVPIDPKVLQPPTQQVAPGTPQQQPAQPQK